MRLFIWELRKLWSSSAARGGMVIVGVVLALSLIATALHEPRALDLPEGVVGRTAAMAQHDTNNAWHFARHLLAPVVGLLVPAVLLVVLSGTIAGEGEDRTLAEPLSRGVRRGTLVVAKLAAGSLYALALIAMTAVVALAIAPLVMKTGPVMPVVTVRTATASTSLLDSSTAAFRLAGAYAVAFLGMLPIVALAVLVSALSETARGAAVAGAGIYFALSALQYMPGLEGLRPYLVVNHVSTWRTLLGVDIAYERVAFGAGVLVVAFLLLSAASVLIVSGRELSSGSHAAR